MAKILAVIMILSGMLFGAGAIGAEPVELRCEYLVNPMGIDVLVPRFSWQNDSMERDWRQTAYEILVATKAELLKSGSADVWDSGKAETDGESVGIAYGGPKLQAGQRYYWTVRVWDGNKKVSNYAPAAWWETGLLTQDGWKAKWISRKDEDEAADLAAARWIWLGTSGDAKAGAAVTFRRTFELIGNPLRAAILLTARSDFDLKVNGKEVTRKHGWMSFDRQEIGYLLRAGKNEIEVTVTPSDPGEYDPNRAEKLARPPAMAGVLKINEASGNVLRIGSDGKWEARGAGQENATTAVVADAAAVARIGKLPESLPEPAALLRHEFELKKNVKRARVYASALGSYRLYANGKRVGEDVLTPGSMDYRKRVLYQTYDVTGMLKRGKNVIGAILGDGWYGSGFTWDGERFFAAPDRLLAQLEVEYEDGTRDEIVSDESWRTAASPILHSEIYAGETYDARLEQNGWNMAGFDEGKWRPAAVIAPAEKIVVESQKDTPASVVKIMPAKAVNALADGSYVIDLGQNMVGWAKLKVKGAAGTVVRLRYAEVLNPDGTIYRENLRNADATDLYVLRGAETEEFEPHFTFHGFRYVEVSGYPGKLALDAIEGHVVSSLRGDGTGKLSTSSELVNRMWAIGLWGQRGNFVTIPTDCPQRDERLGWMGDAAAFWRTGSYNFDTAAFSEKWLQDVRDAQLENGAFTNVSPNTLPFAGDVGAPGWGDAGVIVPYTTWLQYGDKRVIEENWDAMERWMKFIEDANPDHLRKKALGPNFSDWLAPDERTPSDLIATAYWALIAQRMQEMAHAVSRREDEQRYRELGERIRAAYQKEYVHSDGKVKGDTQTGYVLTLQMNLAPKELEAVMVENLVKGIEARDGHLSTGFLGTPFLLFALSDHGRADVAYKLLLTETYPSWGYMLSKGATTWWERWNGDTGDPAMNSYNHYAFGSVVAWVYRRVAGIDTVPNGGGFRQIEIRPLLDDRISEARGEYESVYGKIVSEWKGTKQGPFVLKVRIPANTVAKVSLPNAGKGVATINGVVMAEEAGRTVQVGSGEYTFEVK
jgi:alpha-L-rhamnosidase